MNHQIDSLGTEKINKLIASFSLPAIIGMLVMASYNIVDRIFVGRGVGTLAISGIAISFPISILIIGFGQLIGMGATALISIKLGEKKKDEAENILGTAFLMIIIVGFLLSATIYLCMVPVLKILGGSGEVLHFAERYLRILLLGIPLQLVSFALNGIIRAEGNPRMALATILIGGGLNIILNPVFIFVLHFSIEGSALATIISQLVSAIWVFIYFTNKKSYLQLKLKLIRFNKKVILKILSIGVSPFMMQATGSVITIIFNKTLLEYGGNIAVAVMSIGNSIMMLIMMPIFGLNQGIQPIIGYNYGAKNIARVKETFKMGLIIATSICTAGFIAIELFSRNILSVFNSTDMHMISLGSHALKVFLIMLPLSGFQIVIWAYFQAVGKPKQSIILTMSKQVLIIVPLVLILPHFFNLEGVWMTAPIADFCSACLAIVLIYRELKHLNSIKPEEVVVKTII